MEIKNSADYIELIGIDYNGSFSVEIKNDCSNIRIERLNCNLTIHTNSYELKIIRDAINEVLAITTLNNLCGVSRN
jgi:hypothetical protein